jgi:hypothetical protein
MISLLLFYFGIAFQSNAAEQCKLPDRAQAINEIVDSFTSLEIRCDEVQSVQIENISQVSKDNGTYDLKYTIQLKEPSHLSKSVVLNDNSRKKVSVIKTNQPSEDCKTFSSSLRIDGHSYLDPSDDDRKDTEPENEKFKKALISGKFTDSKCDRNIFKFSTGTISSLNESCSIFGSRIKSARFKVGNLDELAKRVYICGSESSKVLSCLNEYCSQERPRDIDVCRNVQAMCCNSLDETGSRCRQAFNTKDIPIRKCEKSLDSSEARQIFNRNRKTAVLELLNRGKSNLDPTQSDQRRLLREAVDRVLIAKDIDSPKVVTQSIDLSLKSYIGVSEDKANLSETEKLDLEFGKELLSSIQSVEKWGDLKSCTSDSQGEAPKERTKHVEGAR